MAITAEFRPNPATSTAAFGRMFYGLDNRIMFSQVLIDDLNTLGRCYQKNDPTSPDISDLLATDGGDIQLQNAGAILKLEEFLNGIIAFCEKGVFYVYGPQSGFNATEYTIQKVTEFSLYAVEGTQRIGDALMYVSQNGVFVLQPNEFGQLKAVNITEQTINTYYQEFVRSDIFAGYDIEQKQVFFVSRSTKKGLVYDTRVQGWFPYQYTGPEDLLLSALVRKRARLLFVNQNTATATRNFATQSSRAFTDFGVSYESYLLSQPETLGDFTKRQTAINMKALFEKTEETITGYENGAYVFDYPSSCTFQAYWDFDKSNAYRKWTREVVLYKPHELYKPEQRGFIPDSFPYVFDTGESVIEKRINIRGTGKAVQFKFSSDAGKDMRLLGFGVEWAQGTRQ